MLFEFFCKFLYFKVKGKMSKRLSKRAIEGRNWRVSARQKRRLNTIISEYVRLTHQDIYNECKTFYISVVDKYTQKQNLTKTEEFRLMLKNREAETTLSEVESANTLSESEQSEAEMAGEQQSEAEMARE